MLENPGYSPPTILRAVQTCSLAEDSHSLRSQTQGGQWAPGLCQTELALLMSGVSFVGKLLGGYTCFLCTTKCLWELCQARPPNTCLPRDTPQPVNSVGPMPVASGIDLGIQTRALT